MALAARVGEVVPFAVDDGLTVVNAAGAGVVVKTGRVAVERSE